MVSALLNDPQQREVVLSLRGISQVYGAAQVLSDVSFDVHAGEVVAIVGENGAGKSTLMRIMTGLQRPTSGEVFAGSDSRRVDSVRQARSAGVVLIPQELAYMPHASVAENVSLGQWTAKLGFVDRARLNNTARDVMELLGGPSDVRRKMVELTLGEQQLVEIGKALALSSSKLLCLDEPTAALNRAESQRLLEVLGRLKRRGNAAIYVSHRLDEISVIADKILVLRNGRQVGFLDAHEADPARIAALMLGREHTGRSARSAAPLSATPSDMFQLSGWTYDAQPRLESASLEVQRGEVLGVYGLAGSGVESLARGLGGLLPAGELRGEISLFGDSPREAFRSPRDARRARVIFLPGDRKRDGLMLSQSIAANLSTARITRFSRWGFVRTKHERLDAVDQIARYRVRATGPAQEVGALSGGNQQKVLFANRAEASPNVLVVHEPTRGVDVGARVEIHAQLRLVAQSGRCVILISTDIEEVVDVADRVAVMRHGTVVATLADDEISDDAVLAWAATERGSDK